MSLTDAVKKKFETTVDELEKSIDAEQAAADKKLAEAEDDKAKADIKDEARNVIQDLKDQLEKAKKAMSS